MEIALTDVCAQSVRMSAGDSDARAHAAERIAENRAAVHGWLDAARATAQ